MTIEVIAIQSKLAAGFQETVITKLLDFTNNCLPLNADLTSPPATDLYNLQLLSRVQLFHDIYRRALTRKLKLHITYYYVTLAEGVHPKVVTRVSMLEERIRDLYSAAEVKVEPVGAAGLLKFYNQAPTRTLQLDTTKAIPLSTFGTSYICLVTLPNFYSFITQGNSLREHIFEANVRDFQGNVKVNNEISETLAMVGQEEFWWLNNGITVLCSDVAAAGDLISITDPVIVNGLQTSFVVFNHFRDSTSNRDTRNILVRVIRPNDMQSIDRIINATNSQTQIPRIWLHATEPIHLNIETVLKSVELYYDRRKNYYHNRDVAVSRIVTLPYLSQAVASIALQKPDDARARPTTVADRNYANLFSEHFPIEHYAKCALLMKKVDSFLDGAALDRAEKNDIMFHLAMYVASAALKSPRPARKRIATMDVAGISAELMADSFTRVVTRYRQLGATDRVAKGPQLAEALREELRSRFGRRSRQS